MEWTDDKITALVRLWAEGKSTGEIGRIIGVSKNAVVGKAHRLNLEPRPSPIKRALATRGALTERDVGDVPSISRIGRSGKKKNDGVVLTDLTMRTCRWPVGDPKDVDFHFCGRDVELGKPYCAEHLAQAFVGVKR